MVKNILCYGDSNTWGYDAETKGRFPLDIRWTGVLQKELGDGYRVIEEGLGGRTTVWDDPIEGYKNGKTYLIPCLESHKPLDLVIIMLGTNDLKKRFSLSAFDIAAGAGELVHIAKTFIVKENMPHPRVLLVSPIHVGENIGESELNEMFNYENSIPISKRLSFYFKQIAEQYNCDFLDAAEIVTATPVDAIHFDAKGHHDFGRAVAKKVRAILQT